MKYDRKELCRKYRNSRNSLYKKRASLLRKQQSGKLSEKQLISSDNKIKNLSEKIDKYKSRIFKCGKKYEKLRTKRTSLRRKRNRISKKIRSGKFDGKAKNKLYIEVSELDAELRDVYALMGKDVFVEKGKIKTIRESDTGLFKQFIPIWQLRGEVKSPMDSGDFSFMNIDGEVYSLEINFASVLFAIDDFVDKVHLTQIITGTKTPMAWLTLDVNNKTITISSIDL